MLIGAWRTLKDVSVLLFSTKDHCILRVRIHIILVLRRKYWTYRVGAKGLEINKVVLRQVEATNWSSKTNIEEDCQCPLQSFISARKELNVPNLDCGFEGLRNNEGAGEYWKGITPGCKFPSVNLLEWNGRRIWKTTILEDGKRSKTGRSAGKSYYGHNLQWRHWRVKMDVHLQAEQIWKRYVENSTQIYLQHVKSNYQGTCSAHADLQSTEFSLPNGEWKNSWQAWHRRRGCRNQ